MARVKIKEQVQTYIDNRLTSSVKLLCKVNSDRLMSTGKYFITNGHWLIRFNNEVWNTLPDTIEIGKGAYFPIKKRCTLENKQVDNYAQDLKGVYESTLNESNLCGEIENEDGAIMCLLRNDPSEMLYYSIKKCAAESGEKGTLVSKQYMDRILKIMNLDKWYLPEYTLFMGKKDEPIVLKTNLINAIIMPLKL